MSEREKGPVRILCDEIDFKFDPRIERPEILVAFVRELVSEIEHERDLCTHLSRVTGKVPSEGSAEVLLLAKRMLERGTQESAATVHDAAHRLNPEDAYPTDHLIDMLSSCASAIRFGLEAPCTSRHAASAAQHVWKHLYGVSRFDGYTPKWEKDWISHVLQRAIIAEYARVTLASPPPPTP